MKPSTYLTGKPAASPPIPQTNCATSQLSTKSFLVISPCTVQGMMNIGATLCLAPVAGLLHNCDKKESYAVFSISLSSSSHFGNSRRLANASHSRVCLTSFQPRLMDSVR